LLQTTATVKGIMDLLVTTFKDLRLPEKREYQTQGHVFFPCTVPKCLA